MSNVNDLMGRSALVQILMKTKKNMDVEEQKSIVEKVENSANRFDKKGKGETRNAP